MTDSLTIRQPDDWHVHLRDGDMLRDVVDFTARQFGRAIVMPNLAPPITTVKAAMAYKDRILEACTIPGFDPLMTAYLTDSADADELERGHAQGVFAACKLYPANATTNSAHGVTDIKNIHSALGRMEKIGLPLLVHGEVTDREIDIFDREAVFIDRILMPLMKKFPALKIVFEHITTQDAAQFVEAGPETIAATITPHHLEFSRNALFDGGLRPHAYCLPVAKRETHRLALRKAATSGSPKFFLGTDTAPHMIERKEMDCGCAGIFNAPHALESYVKTFDEDNALDQFEAFASLNGPRFYGLKPNEKRVTLSRNATEVPETIAAQESCLVPFHAGKTLAWSVEV